MIPKRKRKSRKVVVVVDNGGDYFPLEPEYVRGPEMKKVSELLNLPEARTLAAKLNEGRRKKEEDFPWKCCL